MSDKKYPLELVEPTFVLRGSDPLAPSLIRQWARRRELEMSKGRLPNADPDDIKRARELALDMETWAQHDAVHRYHDVMETFHKRFGPHRPADIIKLSSRRPQ